MTTKFIARHSLIVLSLVFWAGLFFVLNQEIESWDITVSQYRFYKSYDSAVRKLPPSEKFLIYKVKKEDELDNNKKGQDWFSLEETEKKGTLLPIENLFYNKAKRIGLVLVMIPPSGHKLLNKRNFSKNNKIKKDSLYQEAIRFYKSKKNQKVLEILEKRDSNYYKYLFNSALEDTSKLMMYVCLWIYPVCWFIYFIVWAIKTVRKKEET